MDVLFMPCNVGANVFTGFCRLNSGCKGVIILISTFPFLILTSPTRRQSSIEVLAEKYRICFFFGNFS